MANLYTTVPYKGRPDEETASRLMQEATEANDWECLKPYPLLLWRWQAKHRNDVLDIARWVSHFRMPFMRPDMQRASVSFGSGDKKVPYVKTFVIGSERYGHKLCKPNCGECDYITGEKIEEKMPF